MEVLDKKVIIRADRAGVFFGTLKSKRETLAGVEVELEQPSPVVLVRGCKPQPAGNGRNQES